MARHTLVRTCVVVVLGLIVSISSYDLALAKTQTIDEAADSWADSQSTELTDSILRDLEKKIGLDPNLKSNLKGTIKSLLKDTMKASAIPKPPSLAMEQILNAIATTLKEYKGDKCHLAAANSAWSATNNASKRAISGAASTYVDVLETALLGGEKIAKNLVTNLGKGMGETALKALKKKVDKALDDTLKDHTIDTFSRTPWTKGGGKCKVNIRVVWSKAKGTFSYGIFGNCDCKKLPTGRGSGEEIELERWNVTGDGTARWIGETAEKDNVKISPAVPITSMKGSAVAKHSSLKVAALCCINKEPSGSELPFIPEEQKRCPEPQPDSEERAEPDYSQLDCKKVQKEMQRIDGEDIEFGQKRIYMQALCSEWNTRCKNVDEVSDLFRKLFAKWCISRDSEYWQNLRETEDKKWDREVGWIDPSVGEEGIPVSYDETDCEPVSGTEVSGDLIVCTRPNAWAGTWDSPDFELSTTQSGSTVNGNYILKSNRGDGRGTYTGTVEGNVLTGSYTWFAGTGSPNGSITFTLSADCNSLGGPWKGSLGDEGSIQWRRVEERLDITGTWEEPGYGSCWRLSQSGVNFDGAWQAPNEGGRVSNGTIEADSIEFDFQESWQDHKAHGTQPPFLNSGIIKCDATSNNQRLDCILNQAKMNPGYSFSLQRISSSECQLREQAIEADECSIGNANIIRDSFCDTDGGWLISGDAQSGSVEPTHRKQNGEAYIEATDDVAGGVWYWEAPERFKGNLCNFIGGTLTFASRQSALDSGFDAEDVVIEGPGGKLVYDIPDVPQMQWTEFTVALEPGENWAQQPDQYIFEKVLKNVSGLRIRGEFRAGPDIGALNDVALMRGNNQEDVEHCNAVDDKKSDLGPSEEVEEVIAEGEDATALEDLKKKPLFEVKVSRQEGLLMGLRNILRALELNNLGELPNMVAWQAISGGKEILTLDSLRLVAVPKTEKGFEDAVVTWYQRRGNFGGWATLGTGRELIFRVPEVPGALELYAEATMEGATHRSTPLSFKIEKSLCQGFYLAALALIADSVYFTSQFAQQGQTYAENWANKNTAPRTIKMKIDASTGKPFEPSSGDIILRTAGPISKTMGTLGSPGSPQTHSGILKVEVMSSKRKVHVVHHVVTNGYGSLPLTPGDVVLGAGSPNVGKGQVSFLADATIGSLQIWRPLAYVFDASQGGFVEYGTMGTIAASRISKTKEEVKGYDFGFMESSKLSREAPFRGLYYCNEFVRDVYGFGQYSDVSPLVLIGANIAGFNTEAGKPRRIPLLERFWRGAFDCDREAAEARKQNTTLYGPGRLSKLLNDIDLDQVTFDETDPKKNIETRQAVAALIRTLRTYLDRASISQILTDAVTGAVGEKTTDLKTQADKAAAVANDTAQRLGVPSEYGNLVFIGLQSTLRSWIAVGDRKIADHLVEEMIADLSDTVGTGELLQGGFTTADGQTIFVTFEKISL